MGAGAGEIMERGAFEAVLRELTWIDWQQRAAMPWVGASLRKARQPTAAPARPLHALHLEGSSSVRNLTPPSLVRAG